MKIESRQQLIGEIAEALAMRLDEGCFYLNLTEQEVGLHIPTAYSGEEYDWPHNGDMVMRIEPLASYESYGAMEEFADMQSRVIADKLHRVLNGRHPFARFKEAVAALNLLDEWYAFENKWYAQKAEEWLQEEGVSCIDGKIVCTRDSIIWEADEDDY